MHNFSEHFWKIQPEDGNETLIFKRFRLFRSRLDSSDCESPSKCFLLSNFDIPAYYLAGFSKRLSTVTSPVRQNAFCCLILIFQRTIWLDFRKGYRQLQAQCPEYPPPPFLPNFPVPSSYKNGNCLNIPTSLDHLDNILPRK